jgi:bis(5'-adenosyl)-triphosphatase
LGYEAISIMPLTIPKSLIPIHFGTFPITSQIFHLTTHSFAFVNLKPIVPGHVLISPLRRVPRLRDLSDPEIADLFVTVQRVGRMVQRVYGAAALNIAVQDGEEAGQSVPHVHAHVIPRGKGDFGGQVDQVYEKLEGEEGDVGKELKRRERLKVEADEDRKARGLDEMEEEAKGLADEMDKESKIIEKEGTQTEAR